MVEQQPNSADLEAMIGVVASYFKVDKTLAENMIDWAKNELKLKEIPKDENTLYDFGLRLTEVLGPEGLNGGTRNYVQRFINNYRLSRILYGLKDT